MWQSVFHVLVSFELKVIGLFYHAVSEERTVTNGSVFVLYNNSNLSLDVPPRNPSLLRNIWYMVLSTGISLDRLVSEVTACTPGGQPCDFCLHHSVHNGSKRHSRLWTPFSFRVIHVESVVNQVPLVLLLLMSSLLIIISPNVHIWNGHHRQTMVL